MMSSTKVTVLDFKNSGGWTCLMYAAYYDHPNIVRWLLEGNMYNEYRGPAKRNPVNPLIKNRFGKTSLMLASSCGHNESVETILNCCKASLSAKQFSVICSYDLFCNIFKYPRFLMIHNIL